MIVRNFKAPKLGKNIRGNPGMTQTLISTYEALLVRLIKRAKKPLKDALRSNSSQREMAKVRVDTTKLRGEVGLILKTEILEPAEEQGPEHIKKSHQTGQARADQFLKSIGITAMVGELPANQEALDILNTSNLASLKGFTDELEKKVLQEMTEGLNRGEGIYKLSKRIDGVVNDGIVRARRIARTETMKAFNQAAMDRYERHGIKEWEYISARKISSKGYPVCTVCIPNDGKHFPVGGGPRPPLHPNCRCIPVPVVEAI